MKKKIIIISIIIILFLIGGIYLYIESFKEDRKETLKLMEEVHEDYPIFSKYMTEFVNKRNAFYKQKESVFLEDIGKDLTVWTKFMDDYETIISNIEESSKRLKPNCKNDFGDINAKTECNQFRVNYEAASNYYITDVKVYNKIVKDYNSWVDLNGNGYEKLKPVELTIHKKYIDYDEDGEYFGKEGSK